jgi:NTP pyrophosphohydrolases including oxidative damage repair enzymes
MSARFIPEDEHLSMPVLTTETVYAGAIWNVVRETFAYNDDVLSRDYVDHTGAVAIVALTEDDEVMMIRQYRHSIRSLNWEIPAGLLDIPGEDPLVCGKRELAEEADLEAAQWEFLTTLNTTPGGSNEFIHIYLATGLAALTHDYVRTGEEADLEKRFVPLKDAVGAAVTGKIRNQIAVTALLAAYVHRQ